MSAAELWSNIHMVIAFYCACLPIFKPLWVSASTSIGNFIGSYTRLFRSILNSSGEHSANTPDIHKDPEATLKKDSESAHTMTKEKNIHVTTVANYELEILQVSKGSMEYTRSYDIV